MDRPPEGALDHTDPVAELEGLLLVVGHQDRRDSQLALDPVKRAAQLRPDLDVQRSERLVQEKDLGLRGEGARQGDTLLLPPRKLTRVAAGEPRQAHQGEKLVPPGNALPPGPLADGEAELDVFGHRHVLEEGVILEHETGIALLR